MSTVAGMDAVLRSAVRFEQVASGCVLTAREPVYSAGRDSFDHDHVLADLQERYDQVLEAVEATEGGIEAGLRQLCRTRELEVQEVDLDGRLLRVPTIAEILRVKAYLVVQRNQTRDYLDVVALADRVGEETVATLAGIDDYYRDRSGQHGSVLTALVQRLAEPAPRDTRTTSQLASYKNLDPRWQDWSQVVVGCQQLADALLEHEEQRL